MAQTRGIVSNGLMKRTEVKIPVRQPLLSASINADLHDTYLVEIQEELNVKNVIIDKTLTEGVLLDTTMTDELIQEGDTRKLIRAVQEARKIKNLTPKDVVKLTVSREVSKEIETICNVTINVDEIFISDTSVLFTDGKVYYSL